MQTGLKAAACALQAWCGGQALQSHTVEWDSCKGSTSTRLIQAQRCNETQRLNSELQQRLQMASC